MLKKILNSRKRFKVLIDVDNCQECRLYVTIRNKKKGFLLSSSNQWLRQFVNL